MAGELFKSMAGIDVVHIPHKGSDGARFSILSGQVQMMFDAITTMAPNVRAGKLKGFGTSGRARSSVLPDVPTVAEAGVPGYESTIWLGLVAPAGTPRAVVDRLNSEIRKITGSAEVEAAWAKQGATPLSMSPGEFEKYLHEDIAKWAKVIAQAGIKRD
jgi:tripartite-type tricarboxylate transporter receptor subunit TctC